MAPDQEFPSVQLLRLPGAFAVLRLPPGAPTPPTNQGAFYSVTRTQEETSVVLPEQDVPPGALAETGFALLRVKGTLDFGLTGVLAGLSAPLAKAGLSIFVVSTYDTDYLLLPAVDLEAAIAILRNAGHFLEG
jgi:uncharacterized protein